MLCPLGPPVYLGCSIATGASQGREALCMPLQLPQWLTPSEEDSAVFRQAWVA